MYAPGGPQPSFDKQFVRDYLETIRWNKQPPVPSLPDDVIAKTGEKYVQAFQLLSGLELGIESRGETHERATRSASSRKWWRKAFALPTRTASSNAGSFAGCS
jgi:hypothetical protein